MYRRVWLSDSNACLIHFSFLKAYVSDYNIFLKSSATANSVQLTFNGKKNEILNGIPDWVYEGLYRFCNFLVLIMTFAFSLCTM